MNTEMLTLQQAADRLLQMDRILLLCHKNPDGDTVGSACALCHALCKLGKQAAIACNDEIPARYSYMQIPLYQEQFEPAAVVAVDVAGMQLFGSKTVDWAKRCDLCIDHHASHSYYADGLVLDPTAAACAEIVLRLIEALDVELTPLMADCLYTGVATDTGCFKFANVTPETHMAAAKLMQLGADFRKLNALLFESKSRSQLAVEAMVLKNMEYHFGGRCAITSLTLEEIAACHAQPVDLESVTGIARAIEGVQVGITMRQQPTGSYKISVRSGLEVDAAAIATAFGGGGHHGAAGCEVFGSLENAKQALISEVIHHLPDGGEDDYIAPMPEITDLFHPEIVASMQVEAAEKADDTQKQE